MNIYSSNYTSNCIRFESLHSSLFLPHGTSLRFRELRDYRKRRRLKLIVQCQLNLNYSFETLFHDLLSQFPSSNSLDLLAPVLGAFSGLAFYNASNKKLSKSSPIGNWILFTSPTPFNRFVLLRCPSISFEESELLENVNEKLVKEDRHFVRVDSGIIQLKTEEETSKSQLEYQRVCVNTEDGGVISLDWPANLDLEDEHGLDTTLLLIPGTAEGSMESNIQLFVCEALQHGFFPVVMNPRGCAGSPLTTARLFTAADSDDVCTAIQFINKARPWTTLMAVGYGYGANMLTKYLAEVGDRAPLTAATCIENPFDLEEATRSSPHNTALDQKLANGLTDILRSNRQLFQGRGKDFDVEMALSAKSVRDFEKKISMISYGFDDIKDFYSKCSTRVVIGNVKTPLLFIQNEGGTVPPFSIPRSLIAENPFTSLLFWSHSPASVVTSNGAAESWCQRLIIEWLTAVELGLLKGRHPLLEDVDVTINPSKGLAFTEDRTTTKHVKINQLVDLIQTNSSNGYSLDPSKDLLEESDDAAHLHLRSRKDSRRQLELVNKVLPEGENGAVRQSISVHAESTKEEEGIPEDSERGQVLQTAEVVMNMLDVTAPGTMTAEEKQKVLTAVSRGENFMKALQDAVPEDVRGKLMTAVSGVVHAEGSNLKFDKLMGIGKIPNASSDFKSKTQEKVRGVSAPDGLSKDPSPEDQVKTVEDITDGSDNIQPSVEDPVGKLESEHETAEAGQFQSTSNEVDSSSEVKKSTDGSEENSENDASKAEKSVQELDSGAKRSESGAKPSSTSLPNKAGDTEEAGAGEYKVDQDGGVSGLETRAENSNQKSGEKGPDYSANQNKMTSANVAEEAFESPGSSSEIQPGDNQKSDNRSLQPAADQVKSPTPNVNTNKSLDSSADQNKTTPANVAEEAISSPGSSSEVQPDDNLRENKTLQQAADQSKSTALDGNPNKSTAPDISPPSFNVTQALDALTGMDDSTQVAVNSVFGVIENMITQLEGQKDDDAVNDKKEVKDEEVDGGSGKEHPSTDHEMKKNEANRNKPGVESHTPSNHLAYSHLESISDSRHDVRTGWVEEESIRNPTLYEGNDSIALTGNSSAKHIDMNKKKKSVNSELLLDHSDKLRYVKKIPVQVAVNLNKDSLQNESFHKYPRSDIQNTKPLDSDATNALFLDYFPDEGQWKLWEQPENIGESAPDSVTGKRVDKEVKGRSFETASDAYEFIEPSYVVLDTDKRQEAVGEYEKKDNMNEYVAQGENVPEELIQMVKRIILDSLKIEVDRRLSPSDRKYLDSELARDLEKVADAVSLAVEHDALHISCLDSKDCGIDSLSEKVGTLHGGNTIRAISLAVRSTSYLRRVIPVGVIVGSSLAALREHFNVSAENDNGQNEPMVFDSPKKSGRRNHVKPQIPTDKMPINEKASLSDSRKREGVIDESKSSNNNGIMVGAVTAALGASALLVNQAVNVQDSYKGNEGVEISIKPIMERGNFEKETNKLEESMTERNQNNIVTSIAEKAMSVASPVVPTKEDGELDHERLVAMLADLGQKGGMLKLVGKVALLWGGIRGAMSLTDKLMSFLHIAEQPLFQRILGFVGMVLVLWSPVLVPLLPALVQSWTTKSPFRIAEFVCIIGLYAAVMLLVLLWGRKIHGFENPLEQYGLDLTSLPKIKNFLKGLVAGIVLVLLIHSANALLGCASFSKPSTFTSSFDALTWLNVCGNMFIRVSQGIITATSIVLVEELLFRSWLPEEIASDLGYHRGIIISGLAFSLTQRSFQAIPGLWLLSLALSGARQRSQGSLSVPIGLRTGIVASSFVLKSGGFLMYKSNYPLWVTGMHPFQPFSGVVGLAFSLILAIALYPRQPLVKEKLK